MLLCYQFLVKTDKKFRDVAHSVNEVEPNSNLETKLRYENPKTNKKFRDVAQFGSAPALGAGGRRFKSCRPDFFLEKIGLHVEPTVYPKGHIDLYGSFFAYNSLQILSSRFFYPIFLRISGNDKILFFP